MQSWAHFSQTFLLLVAVGLVGGAGWMVLADPYWAFHRDPPWLAATSGANRVLDTADRRAKPLQFILREAPDAVLIGSSVVYRGIDPAHAPGPERLFNFGMSSLTSRELPDIAKLVASRPAVAKVFIGLDYFAFTAFAPPVRIDPGLASGAGRAHHVVTSLLTLRGLADSVAAYLAPAYEPGGWKRNGFRDTPERGPDQTRRENSVRRGILMPFDPAATANLADALRVLGGRNVSVYLTPVNAAQKRLIDEKGLAGDFDRWRKGVADTAAAAGVRFFDFSDLPMFDDFDSEKGSSQFWFDNLHFKPVVGDWLLARLVPS